MHDEAKKRLESRMLRKLHVRFGVGVEVQSLGLHHDVIVERWEKFTGRKAERLAVEEVAT
jgi:hypothetical protein